jgi:aurora kinase
VIGRGATSRVVLMKDPNGVGTIPVKHFHNSIYQSVYMTEIEILVKLNHPCILRIFGYVLPSKTAQAEIHMEWASNGSLARVLELGRGSQCPSFFNPTGKAIIICGIVLGMRFMHSRGFIHQDLKPSNILLNAQGRVLLADFGASRYQQDDLTPDPAAGTIEYAAPEMGEEIQRTPKVDVYSFGLILYELLVGSPVFRKDETPFEIIRRKRKNDLPEIRSGVIPSMKDLVRACWDLNPDRRPSFDQMLNMFETVNFDIVPGAKGETVREYVRGIVDWELSRPCLQTD